MALRDSEGSAKDKLYEKYKLLDYVYLTGFCMAFVLLGYELYLSVLANTPMPMVLYFLISLVLAFLAADFLSGVAHFTADNFGDESFEYWYQFIEPFRIHHDYPKEMCTHDFLELNASSSIFVAIIYLFTYYLCPIISSEWGFVIGQAVLLMGVFLLITNSIHRYAHLDNPPKWIRRLQKMHLILSPREHDIHHITLRSHYCITNGWTNYFCDKYLFSKILAWKEKRVKKNEENS